MEYLEIKDKLHTIVLTVPKRSLVQQLTMAVVDMLKVSRARIAELEAQLAAIRATDNGTIDTEEEQ
jgi:hypothetical protein